ncbi:alpha/beta hydrolase [Streptomyces sp. NPDC056224]|uniref:alpha/beta hydrolase n=1 Tax=Streptomyces sp. NPDC056224 TaxID=3345750 RepID=UPI0035DE5773
MSVRRAPSESRPVPTPKAVPPFDPELSVALAALGKEPREPITLDGLAARQERDAARRPRPTAEQLRADGRFEVSELCVPGPPDGPDVTLVSARPSAPAGRPLPLLYYMHGGAMIMGNAWSVLPRILREWVLPLELAVISVEYRLAPRTQYPGPLEERPRRRRIGRPRAATWAPGHRSAAGPVPIHPQKPPHCVCSLPRDTVYRAFAVFVARLPRSARHRPRGRATSLRST